MNPRVNIESQLVWKDLEQGVDVLAGDGKPRFMKTQNFLNLADAKTALQVARLHHEIWVEPNHDVVGEVFLGVPEHIFMIESWQTDAQGICLDRQLVQTDPHAYAKVMIIMAIKC